MTALRDQRQISGRRNFKTELATHLPARLVDHLARDLDLTGNLADWSDARLTTLFDRLQNWSLRPSGSEGYRTAEVTLGGIATDEISSKSMMSKRVPGLYVVGEAMDVTGWLGGYNFQWAWSSGMAAARDIMAVS
jgi:predicted flavoprotein YhiN